MLNYTYYCLNNLTGVIHVVPIRGYRESLRFSAFRRSQIVLNWYCQLKDEADRFVMAFKEVSILEWPHDIQHAFPNANGTFKIEDNATTFFERIGWTKPVKAKVIRNCKKMDELMKVPGKPGWGRIMLTPEHLKVNLPYSE